MLEAQQALLQQVATAGLEGMESHLLSLMKALPQIKLSFKPSVAVEELVATEELVAEMEVAVEELVGVELTHQAAPLVMAATQPYKVPRKAIV